ncbi:MAG TPA: hypothetical protein VKB12_16295, partial [Pyrinomonadaceae bacterium]|nr:hypothetical protein [Pyrinomonadaceae bacterium]
MLKACLLSLALVIAAASAAPARAQGQGGGGAASMTLTNASVVKLVRAGFREKTVIAIIAARPVNFDLTPERLIELKKSGVSERVILAMLARTEAVEFASDDWDDMPLDGDSGASKSPGASDPGSVNIFGSSGGAHGRTRSRNGNGGADNDTQTVGSASVRIVRPPAEGNAQTKLERTPTLTNDSVVELVEGGFSEGTIVRRIEQSP